MNIICGLKSFGRNSRVGFMLNDRRYEGSEGSNTVLALDGDFALTRSLRFDLQAIYAYTNEGTNDILGIDTLKYDGGYTLLILIYSQLAISVFMHLLIQVMELLVV